MPTLPAITGTTAQSNRVAHAVGAALNLGRDATLAEVSQYLRDHLQMLCQQIERNEANAALVVTPLGLT
jgi:hypothetical protein